VSDYVLSDFEADEDVHSLVNRSADAVETVLREGLVTAQARFN
jgi:peptidyl-tRNA hydrolase